MWFTPGTFHVIMDELHLKNVLKDLVPPPVAAVSFVIAYMYLSKGLHLLNLYLSFEFLAIIFMTEQLIYSYH